MLDETKSDEVEHRNAENKPESRAEFDEQKMNEVKSYDEEARVC